MTFRIAKWAVLGLVVAGGWGIYFANADKTLPIEPLAYLMARLTQPAVSVAISYLRFPVGLPWVAFANAATYALVGFIVEATRKRP